MFHRFLKAILTDAPVLVYGDGTQTRDFTFVQDAVSATIAAADHGESGRVYNIGGGSQASVNHVIELMATCTGRQPRIDRLPLQKGHMRHTYADTSAAADELGFKPSMPLKSGIEEECKWLANAMVAT